ncbi:ubiquitin-conjugating enzyme E2 H [Scaptodrosophila lebanonensis]|uniref:Ubiquitin-conjugating enzyme E2 H n=1 Tax=Drosophila lebanonensis TaxID=7225 RepID=A0A6J2TFB7_DROLE|nr:ubiquitin-conjugating enzyme E2 H [Scaptodrosophila lebanonensis]
MAKVVVNTTSPMSGRRLVRDVNRLIASGYQTTVDDDMASFDVRFEGPMGTAYEGGVWTVNVAMPQEYPLKPPRLRFLTKIWHPNIESTTGLVCMNVFKEAWSTTYDLMNIFDTFLPQLLRNPNPLDPLNHEAAAILKRSEQEFKENVTMYKRMYAQPLVIVSKCSEELEKRSSDLSLSDLVSDDDDDD